MFKFFYDSNDGYKNTFGMFPENLEINPVEIVVIAEDEKHALLRAAKAHKAKNYILREVYQID